MTLYFMSFWKRVSRQYSKERTSLQSLGIDPVNSQVIIDFPVFKMQLYLTKYTSIPSLPEVRELSLAS